jgi:hypothetical protein
MWKKRKEKKKGGVGEGSDLLVSKRKPPKEIASTAIGL